MNNNTSLSSRVRRRNAQGFAGVGNHNGVGKNHQYGDYRDPVQNNKHELGYNKNGEIIVVPSRHEHMITAAKKYGLKHAGSKSAKQLASHF